MRTLKRLSAYSRAIRDGLMENGGRGPARGQIRDRRGVSSLRN
jgi:hypothetical protein